MRVLRATSFPLSALLATLVAGCASVDPTDPSHFTNAIVRNDTPESLVIVQCDTSCDVLHERTTIGTGAAATVNVSNEGITVGYVVQRTSGQKLGCLYMRFNHVRKAPDVNVSSMTRCR